ncbi:MAG: hypothetical protein AAB866_00395, partial [Patescibacteria group bacterium]
MNKKEENGGFFYFNFFPKNRRQKAEPLAFSFFPKQKKGQFFLIISVVIIGLVAGLATITNSIQKQSDVKFYYVGEELKFESEKVIDYGLANNQDLKVLLTGFTQDYSEYSNADNFYYVFGTTTEITFAGCKKTEDGQIKIKDSSGTILSTLTIIKGSCNPLTSTTLSSPPTNIILMEDGINYPFTLKQ